MSWQAAGWALRQDTRSAINKLVLIMLGELTNTHTGQALASLPRLSAYAHVSDRTMMRAIDALENEGLLKVEKRAGLMNIYRLRCCWGQDKNVTGDNLSPVTTTTPTSDTDDTGTPVTPVSPLINTINKKKQNKKKREEGTATPKSKKTKTLPQIPLTDKKQFATKKSFDFAADRGFKPAQIDEMAEKFFAYHQGKGTLFANWEAAWRTWILKEVQYSGAPKKIKEAT